MDCKLAWASLYLYRYCLSLAWRSSTSCCPLTLTNFSSFYMEVKSLILNIKGDDLTYYLLGLETNIYLSGQYWIGKFEVHIKRTSQYPNSSWLFKKPGTVVKLVSPHLTTAQYSNSTVISNYSQLFARSVLYSMYGICM